MLDQSVPELTAKTLESYPGWKIEDYPPGYPRFAALTSSHPSFHVFRRFSMLRARMLLHKQDGISQLESTLERIDLEEPKAIFLGSRRKDANDARRDILAKIDEAMADYDDLLSRTHQAFTYKSARTRDLSNIRDWLGNTGSISREEAAYIWHTDLVSLSNSASDGILDWIEGPIEDIIIWLSSIAGKDFRGGTSRDSDLHIFPDRLVKTTARVILAFLAATFLLIPITITTFFEALHLRLGVVLIGTTAFVIALSLTAKAKMGELFIAGAT
ncbi:hypothetical protein F5Y04DRAFT_260028 [Hypomontagnella monticulosa]|nr:hypothetical protein F5Y04DRAFT_260028 [Hypomontagnella monticulosa]